MLKLVEFGLLGVTLLIVLALVLRGQPEAPPPAEHPIGAREPADGAKRKETR